VRQIGSPILKAYFLGWQCRIRQQSVRQFDGQPTPAMRPRVSTKIGRVIMPAMTVLMVPQKPSASTAFFKFQLQKTNELEEARAAALEYLGADYYQLPELFSDEMTAVFAAGWPTVASLLRAREVLLDFDQYSQSFHIPCIVRTLLPADPARESSLWLARLFNPNVPQDAKILAFRPNWKRAVADPMPQSARLAAARPRM
jgi:hypothetical protein